MGINNDTANKQVNYKYWTIQHEYGHKKQTPLDGHKVKQSSILEER